MDDFGGDTSNFHELPSLERNRPGRAIMIAMSTQNYSNHVKRVPAFGAILILLMATFVGASVNLYKSWDDHQRLYSASLILALSICTIGTALFARTFALKVQDRAIRAEENLRHFVLTGKLMDSRLTKQQIIALRFGDDKEFAELAKKAAETGMAPDDIKKAVKNWRADLDRA